MLTRRDVFISTQSLFGKCHGHVADLCAEFVLSSITADSTPSEDLGQSELKSMKLTVTNRMLQEERHAHTRLRRLREQLQRRRQVTPRSYEIY